MTANAPASASADVVATIADRLGTAVAADPAARAACAIAGVVPGLVARPADVAELAAMVGAVAGAGGTLVALGRGAHRHLGHPPVRYDVALVTEGLGAIRDYTPADMTVTVEAGVAIADLAALLARDGQWLPIEPALPEGTTVGGMLAADLAGPLAASQGRVRDFLIGMRVVTANGMPARAGGRVVKNVAGYDLMKLAVGSLGTLMVITEATFKVRPLPERQHGLVLRTRDRARAFALGEAAAGALAVTIAGDLRGAHATVVVRLGGVGADVAARRARLRDLAARHGATIELDAEAGAPEIGACFAAARDFAAGAAGDLVTRFATLPSRLASLGAAVAEAAGSARGSWQADPTRGVLSLAVAADATDDARVRLAALTRAADAHAAHLVVERWPADLAPTIAVWHPLPPALPLMRRLKDRLDPAGVLAPGRYVGRL